MKYRILIIWLSFKWMFRTNLQNEVWYKGKKYVVVNGDSSKSWKVMAYEVYHNTKLTTRDSIMVKRDECKLVLRPSNILRSFRSGHSFYMKYWYEIWKRNGIQDWMRALPIW